MIQYRPGTCQFWLLLHVNGLQKLGQRQVHLDNVRIKMIVNVVRFTEYLSGEHIN